MTVVGIILAVLAGLCALVFALLFLTVSVRIVYDEKLVLYGGISFVKIKLYPKKENKKKEKKQKHKKKTVVNKAEAEKYDVNQKQADGEKDGAEGQKNEEKAEEKSKKKSVSETAAFIFDIIKLAGETFGKHGKIHIRRLAVNVSKPDAADTAVQFGIVCAAHSTALAACSLFGKAKIDKENVRVIPDFITGKSSLSADVQIGARAIYLVSAAVKIFVNKALKNTEQTERKKQV